jgi:hypothetical protein
MKNGEFIVNIFRQQKKSVPSAVAGSLRVNFPSATGVEWSQPGQLFEAIFFHDNAEKIARFDSDGNLLEYRVNIPPTDIPSEVKSAVNEEFEIMNCISVFISGLTTYELIVRNRDLVRYLMVIDHRGNQVSLKTL